MGVSCPRKGETVQSDQRLSPRSDGDLGTHVPPRRGVALKGRFQTLVGCNDCEGGALRYPSYLQSWVDDGTTLALEKNNVSVSFSGIPAAFTSDTGCHVPGWERSIPSHSCGIRTPAHVIRTADDALLVAMDAYAADGPTTCGKPGTCENLVFFTSTTGLSWEL